MRRTFRVFPVAALCAFLIALSACSSMSEMEMTGTSADLARVRVGEPVAVSEEAVFAAKSADISYENISYLEISDAEAVCEDWGIAGSVYGYKVKHAALQLCPVNGSEVLESVVGAEFVFEDESGASVIVIVSEVEPSEEILSRGVHTVFLSDAQGRILTVMSGDESLGIPETFLNGLQNR